MAYFIGTSTAGYQAPNYEGLFDRIRFKICADTTQNSFTSPVAGLVTSPDGLNGIMPVGQVWTEVFYSNNYSDPLNIKRSVFYSTGSSGQETIYLYLACYTNGSSRYGLRTMVSCIYDPQYGALPGSLAGLRSPVGSTKAHMADTSGSIVAMATLAAPFDYWLVADQNRIIVVSSNLVSTTLKWTMIYSGGFTRYCPISHHPNAIMCTGGWYSTDVIGTLPTIDTAHTLFPYFTDGTASVGSAWSMENRALAINGPTVDNIVFPVRPRGFAQNPDGSFTLFPVALSRYRSDWFLSWYMGEVPGIYTIPSENQDTGSIIYGGDTIVAGGVTYLVVPQYLDSNNVHLAVKLQ